MSDQNESQSRSISHLLDGLSQFQDRFYRDKPDLMRDLVEKGQSPATFIISCSDSRVDPGLITGAEPGELFTVRNVANLVPPYEPDDHLHGTSAALEYAVRDLKVDHIIILGHAHCGGIQAMLSNAAGKPLERDFINQWVSLALDASRHFVSDPSNPTKEKAVPLDFLVENAGLVERAAIKGSLRNLMTYPWVKSRVENKTLSLHGWWFDLDTGDLWRSEPDGDTLFPST
ncbi:carbonic anhydrase [Rhodospirillum sp. A1_3_36]|uniref:carbonic anhydrase n=1 Tax=Rhodospirillum sp. A1_3_36 TaxID=3391666 RepID=UPI0039A54C52